MLDAPTVLTGANEALAENVYKLSKADLYGLGSCNCNWQTEIANFTVISVLECPNDLTVEQEQCLLGKVNEITCS